MYQLSIFEEFQTITPTYEKEWTPEQERIFKFLEREKGNAVLDAVAGSGKTSTIVEASMRLKKSGLVRGNKGNGLFVAFNKAICTELEERLTGTKFKAKTLNSMGYGLLRKRWFKHQWQIVNNKYSAIIRNIARGLDKVENPFESTEDFSQLLDFLRKTNTPLQLDAIKGTAHLFKLNVARYFNTYDYKKALTLLTKAIRKGMEEITEKGVIDFTDQIYAPLYLRLETSTPYDFIFVDEAQDLSQSQIDLLDVFCHSNTRLIFVGDRKQSIYLFNGATPRSMQLLEDRHQAKLLSLTTCFRCPSNHIHLAQEYNPAILPPKKSKQGNIYHVESGVERKALFPRILQHNNPFLILCRFNSPLLKLCYQLNFQEDIRARIRGRDIIPTLLRLCWKIFPSGVIPALGFALSLVEEYRKEYLDDTEPEKISPDFLDRLSSIEVILNNYRPRHVESIEQSLGLLFGEQDTLIQLSTIHRAKGLECENVVILGSTELPYRHSAHTDLEKEQEQNLTYVAYTRSTKNLYLVTGKTL